MRSWTTTEARSVLNWAKAPSEADVTLQSIASALNRTPEAVKEFLRRWLPPGKRPWREKPRWKKEEIAALESGMSPGQRTAAAARKFLQRRREDAPEEGDRTVLTVKQVAADLGISRAKVYRLLRLHYLRRFEGGIAESSFHQLLRLHPEVVPYATLPPEHQEWLVINGYPDPNSAAKKPSTRGLLKG
jgi:hypothetical protein